MPGLKKIAELKAACASLKQEKENVTASYRRLSKKYKALVVRTEQEKVEVAVAHVTDLAMVKKELDKETQDYTKYRLNVRRCLRGLHEVVASSFGEVKAWCFTFLPAPNVKVELLIDWVGGEVEPMLDTI
jgi:seryl-tRNA synthetase